MNLPTFIKEKRAEFDPRCRMMDGFLYYREEDAITFLETCLTQLVEKMEEECIPREFKLGKRSPHKDLADLSDMILKDAQKNGSNLFREEVKRRFHLFKTGEEHTGV